MVRFAHKYFPTPLPSSGSRVSGTCGSNCAYGVNGEWTWIGDKNNGTAVAPMIDPVDFMVPGGGVSTRASTAVGTKVTAAFRTVLRKIFGKAEADALNEIVVKSGVGFVDYGAKDELGRPTGVWAWLTRSMVGTGTDAAKHIIPPGFVRNTLNYSRAHLLARLLGGLGTVTENLVTFALRPSNTPVMSQIEGALAKALTSGGHVLFEAIPVYVGDELIPREITLSVTNSNGYSVVFRIVNELAK